MAGEAAGQGHGKSQESLAVTDDLVLQEGLPMKEVERRIGAAIASAGRKHRVVAYFLRDVHQRGLFAAGMALADLPLIDEAFREAELCWSKVRQLVKVAVGQHDAAWLQRARELRIDELALEVRLAKRGEPPRNRDDRKGLPEIRLRLNASMPPDVYAKWELVYAKIAAECGGSIEPWQCLDALFDLGFAPRHGSPTWSGRTG